MDKRSVSIIIIPHREGKQRSLTLSLRKVKFLVGVAAFFLISMMIFFVDYYHKRNTHQKLIELSAENVEQKDTIIQYEESMENLKATLSHFDSYAKKLNILAGLKSSEVLKEVGIGGGSSSNQELSIDNNPQDLNLNNLKVLNQKAEGIEKNLNTLVNFFENQALRLAATPTIWPTRGYMSSPFGWRDDPFTLKRTFHWGIDIATHFGNPVLATADGVVIQITTGKIGGKTIKISHRGGFTTIYCHLSKFLVKAGKRIKKGQVIGLVGKTGKALGPHVHYEIRKDGKAVNPYYYILEE